MRFLITFNHIDGEWDRLSPKDQERHSSRLQEFMTALRTEKNTELVFFHPATQAKTIRMHPDRSVEVSDGPCHQSSEQPGGFYIIEADSMQDAVEWAEKGRFMVGSKDVRQIAEFPG